jgi:hypothetical protein
VPFVAGDRHPVVIDFATFFTAAAASSSWISLAVGTLAVSAAGALVKP